MQIETTHGVIVDHICGEKAFAHDGFKIVIDGTLEYGKLENITISRLRECVCGLPLSRTYFRSGGF